MANNMFDQMDPGSRKMIADAIFKAIERPVISQNILKLHYPFLPDQTVNELLIMMEQFAIVSKLPDGTYQVNPRKITDIIPPVLWLLMTEGRYKKEEIETALSKLPPLNKKIVSAILTDKNSEFDWFDISTTPAPENKPVAIRFADPNKSYGETFDTIVIAEDMKIAVLNNNKWSIIPPFPLFDYSPLSDKENIKEGASVTHWAEVSEETMKGWETRFDPMGKYSLLNIETDDEHKELLYKTLLWASSFIRQNMETNNNPESSKDLMEYYKILGDLQYCMDSGKPLQNKDKEE